MLNFLNEQSTIKMSLYYRTNILKLTINKIYFYMISLNRIY